MSQDLERSEQMNPKLTRHFFYWVLPTAVVLCMIAMYFSGIHLLQQIVFPAYNRELGLNENLQAALILAVLFIAVQGYQRADHALTRLGFAFVAIASIFQLLEEINYGMHFLNAINPEKFGRTLPWGNVHNQPGVSTRIKNLSDLVLALYFFVLPLAVGQRAPAWLRYLAPPRLIVATMIAMVACSKFAHYLNDSGILVDNPQSNSMSEFRETFIYYIGLLYLWELAYRRRWPGWKGEHGDPFNNQTD